MSERYVSKTMPDSITVKEALDRISQYVPASFVWIKIPEDIEVDLFDPLVCNLITGPGDYVIYKYKNGPEGVQVTPLNVNIRQGETDTDLKVFVFDGVNSYIHEGSGSTWEEAIIDDPTEMAIYRGSDQPDETNYYWLDTSHLGDQYPYIDLKFYNGTDWVSIFASNEQIMLQSTYDQGIKYEDIYKYIQGLLAKALDATAEYEKHTKNELVLIHLAGDKRTKYNTTLLTPDEVADLIATIYTTQVTAALDEKMESETHVAVVEDSITEWAGKYRDHMEPHITAADVSMWEDKIGEHKHENDPNVKISPQDIITGIFPVDQIPDEVKERYYTITSLDEFKNPKQYHPDITDEQIKIRYHNGNAFYMETTNEDDEPIVRWFRVVDATKIGTDSYMEGILEFTNTLPRLIWQNLTNKPTTLAGYKLEDEAYTKTETDEKFKPKTEEHTRLLTLYNSWMNEQTHHSTLNKDIFGAASITPKKLGIQVNVNGSNGTYNDMLENSVLDVIILATVDSVDKIFKTGVIVDSTNQHLLFAPGFSFVELPLDKDQTAEKYFSDRFSTNYATDSANPNFSTSGCGFSASSPTEKITRKVDNITAGGYPVEFTVQMTNTDVQFSTTRLVQLCSIQSIKANATANLESLKKLAEEAYLKWGYPGTSSSNSEGKVIEDTIPVTLAEAVESIIEMPELS